MSNPRHLHSVRNKAGFTLIELLVVIAIISLLVSILVPSLTKAKELTQSSVCSANLRSLGLAFHIYANDNDGLLVPLNFALGNPANGLWYTNLLVDQGYAPFPDSGSWDNTNGRPYGNFSPLPDVGIWQCPSVAIDKRLWGCGYGINEFHMQWYGGSAKLEQLLHAGDRLMISDSHVWWEPNNDFLAYIAITCPFCQLWDIFPGTWSNPRLLAVRHLERGNICFADGHLENWIYDDAYENKNNLFAHDPNGDGQHDW